MAAETFEDLNLLLRSIQNQHAPKRWYWRWLKLWPIHYAHHIQLAFGYVLLPWLPLSLGLFADWRTGGRAVRLVRSRDYHDCTATGVY